MEDQDQDQRPLPAPPRLAPYEHVLITCCLSFQVFRGSVFFLKSPCLNMVMQIQVQIEDTRSLFYESAWEC